MALAVVLAFGGVPAAPGVALAAPADGVAAGEGAQARAERIDACADTFEAGEILVAFEGAGALARVEAAVSLESALPGATLEALSDDAGFGDGGSSAVVKLPEGVSVGSAVVAAEASPRVAYAQPNHVYRLADEVMAASADGLAAPEAAAPEAAVVPVDDPYAAVSKQSETEHGQWWLYSVGAFDAWEKMPAVPAASEDDKVTVAVLDTGTNFEHEDLKDALVTEYAYDAVKQKRSTESPTDEELAHGTHVAGIVAGTADNGVGIAGMSCNYARVLPISVFNLQYVYMEGYVATCSDDTLIRAYNYLMSDPDGTGKSIAERTNTRVVNMSLGGYLDEEDGGQVNRVFENIIKRAQDEFGILTVAAGGNGDGYGNPRTDASYPSDFDEVMSVMALSDDTHHARWSDYNEHKDICAPGLYLTSTWYDSPTSYKVESGTSMASPLVAGCAALLFASDPGLSVADAKDIMYSTATRLGSGSSDQKDGYFAWGKVNPAAALDAVSSARIGAERSSMVRTTSQVLTATYHGDASRNWEWSVEPAGAAEISATAGGAVLTAAEPGEVTVKVTDADDPGIAGTRTFEVADIALPRAPVVRPDGVAHAIDVQWTAAEAATGYRVLRSTSGADGEFACVSGDEPLGADARSFTDEDTSVGVEYWYAVQPIGTLGAARPAGAVAAAVRGYYTDKSALASAIARARELRGSTSLSADGSDVLASGWWTPAAARRALDSALVAGSDALGNGALMQGDIDAATSALAGACDAFEAARAHGTFALPEITRSCVKVGAASYKGSAVQPVVTVTVGGKKLAAGTDYKVAYSANTAPGTGYVTVTGVGSGFTGYRGSVKVSFKIADGRAKQALSMKTVAKTVALAKVKKANQKVSGAIAVKGAKTALSYSVTKVSVAKQAGKFSIDSKGAITVKKGCPKGTYTLTVKATAKATTKYQLASIAKTVKLTVK